jgi:hypothetical protein
MAGQMIHTKSPSTTIRRMLAGMPYRKNSPEVQEAVDRLGKFRMDFLGQRSPEGELFL